MTHKAISVCHCYQNHLLLGKKIIKSILYTLVFDSSLVLAAQQSTTVYANNPIAYANCQCADNSGVVYSPPQTVVVECTLEEGPDPTSWTGQCVAAFPWVLPNWSTTESYRYCSYCGYNLRKKTHSHRP